MVLQLAIGPRRQAHGCEVDGVAGHGPGPGIGSGIVEVLLALNATVEGQSMAHTIAERLAGTGVTISRLAVGVPVGSELDYLDEGTLATAVRGRRPR